MPLSSIAFLETRQILSVLSTGTLVSPPPVQVAQCMSSSRVHAGTNIKF